MIEYLMVTSAFIAGLLIYLAIYKDIEEHLFINIERNLLFPVFILILLVCGVYITETIHLSEVAAQNSNSQQNVSVMGCFIENTFDCSTKANTLNNESYAAIQSGKITTGDFYIPFSLIDVLSKNTLSYFCAGILLIWIIIFGKNLQVRK